VTEIEKFDFYESLRYIFPGYFLLFLAGPLLIPDMWKSLDISEKLVYGIIVGFIIHSFGIYTFVPGVKKIKKAHNEANEKILGKKLNHIILDVLSSSFQKEKNLFKRYYGLGALKLDIVAIIMFIGLIQFLKILVYLLSFFPNSIDTLSLLKNVVILLILILCGFFIRADGLNDLTRALNLELFVILREIDNKNEEVTKLLEIDEKYSDFFFKGQRTTIHSLIIQGFDEIKATREKGKLLTKNFSFKLKSVISKK